MGLFDKEELKEETFTEKESAAPVVEEPVKEAPAEVSIISATTKIEGNVTADGSIVINGDIQGNVTAKGNLVLSGTTTGEIYCNSILVDTPQSESDIIAEENIIVAEGTTVNGNINCRNISIAGSVIGDISATGTAIVKASAKVEGNVSAQQIGVECGAEINGKVSIRK